MDVRHLNAVIWFAGALVWAAATGVNAKERDTASAVSSGVLAALSTLVGGMYLLVA